MAKGLGAAVLSSAVSLTSAASADWYPYSHDTWAGIGLPDTLVCRDGLEQSPVDFPNCNDPLMRSPITLDWTTQAVVLKNNAHTVVLEVPNITASGGMSVHVEGVHKAYALVQCHFHHGSEHTVAGKQYPFEAHCVHALVTDETVPHYGVAGFFYEEGAQDAFLAQFDAQLPSHTASVNKRRLEEAKDFSFNVRGEPLDAVTKRRLADDAVESAYTGPTDFSKLHAGVNMQKYYNYGGSFTTPPCTEAVDFYIFMEPKTMSTSQLTSFKTAMGWQTAGGNFRPPQPLNDRTVWGCTAEPPVKENLAWYPYSAETWATKVGASSHRVCNGGSMQSPIDFASCATSLDREAVAITWADQEVELVNNGHTIVFQMTASSPGGMSVGGKSYTLVQCHVHYSSEHTVAGRPYPFETHCVHAQDGLASDEASHYGVFGIFYTIGSADSFLSTFEDELPAADAHRRLSESAGLNVFGEPLDRDGKRVLASSHDHPTASAPMRSLYGGNARTKYWSYSGSFTTPPCTEAVDFYIMMNPSSISAAQLGKYKAAIGWESAGGNFRPPQPLGARVVTGCSQVTSLRQQTNNAISAGFDSSLSMIIDNTVRSDMQEILREEQNNHHDMMVTLLILAIVVLVLLLATLGLLFMIYKSASA